MSVTLRTPTVDDGRAVWSLVRATGVLDENSVYAYCATFRHFAATSVVAEHEGRIVGFVTAYRLPERPDVLFVWQVGVDAAARGMGLATRMLRTILELPAARDAHWLETTITPDNTSSRALFARLAERLETGSDVTTGITAEQLGGDHADEALFRIGPFRRSTP